MEVVAQDDGLSDPRDYGRRVRISSSMWLSSRCHKDAALSTLPLVGITAAAWFCVCAPWHRLTRPSNSSSRRGGTPQRPLGARPPTSRATWTS